MDVDQPTQAAFAQQGLLDKLPNELLALIRDSFYKYDLVGHINLYRLIPRTASLYPAAADPFWKKLCYMNGLGRLPIWEDEDDDDDYPLDWFRIAFECGCHAVTCMHPACGRARLEENAKHMAAHFQDIPGDIVPIVLTREDEGKYTSASTIFEHITFPKEFGTDDDVMVDACLRSSGDGKPDASALHCIVERSFASLPPVDNMTLFNLVLQTMPDIESKHGVTVKHVLDSMCFVLRNSLSVNDVLSLQERVGWEEIFPQSWSTARRLHALMHLVDWFHVIVWKGIEFVECSFSTHYYAWNFETNPEALESEGHDNRHG